VGEVEVIVELKHEGSTILMAKHEMVFARSVADRLAFLDGGVDGPQHPRTAAFLRSVGPAPR